MGKFIKKPDVVEAFQWTGGPDQIEDPVWAVEAIQSGIIRIVKARSPGKVFLLIKSQQETLRADQGDWIIRGVNGNLITCKPEIFATIYTAVFDDSAKEIRQEIEAQIRETVLNWLESWPKVFTIANCQVRN